MQEKRGMGDGERELVEEERNQIPFCMFFLPLTRSLMHAPSHARPPSSSSLLSPSPSRTIIMKHVCAQLQVVVGRERRKG